MTELESLKGNVILHPSLETPHDTPTFLRSASCRVISGSMLLSGVFSGIAALVTESDDAKVSCAIATAVSFVAFYHYAKLMAIREQSGTRLKLAKPGETSDKETALVLGWQDMAADAVRYSDWLVCSPRSQTVSFFVSRPPPPAVCRSRFPFSSSTCTSSCPASTRSTLALRGPSCSRAEWSF